MADFRVDTSMKVKTLKANFKKEFGATLRVYTTPGCHAFADDDTVLRTLMNGAKEAEVTVTGETKVSEFEKLIAGQFNIGVQVSTPDDSKLCDNDLTLAEAGK